MTTTSTSNNTDVARIRKTMLATITTLRAAVQDPNALMSGNEIGATLQQLEELRAEYAAAAQVAHTEWCERNL